MWYAIWPCSEKVEFWPYDPVPRVMGVCRRNTWYGVADFVILLNSICNISMFWNSGILQICFCFVMRETLCCQTDIIEAFNSTSRYLDDLLNIDNPYFEQMVGQIYPTELQLNKANSSDTEAPFLDLNLPITNGIVSSKIYDKRDDLNFEIINFPFLDGDVPRSPSYGVYISQLIRFARVCSNVDDSNNRNLFLTAK